MKKKKTLSWYIFRMVRSVVDFFYPKTTVEGFDIITAPSVIVGNHAQMNGPIIGELYFPDNCLTWCASQMMAVKEVPEYAFNDFWSQKPRYIAWFYRILSYIIAPLSAIVFNNAKTIPVYHDMRIINTFKKTSEALHNGNSVIIFPEHNTPYNGIVWEFQNKFIDIARFHRRRTGSNLPFVPMYVAPDLKKAILGKPTYFDFSAPFDEERQRICKYLMDEVTRIATSLPEHTVVPYPNLPRKLYPQNKEN